MPRSLVFTDAIALLDALPSGVIEEAKSRVIGDNLTDCTTDYDYEIQLNPVTAIGCAASIPQLDKDGTQLRKFKMKVPCLRDFFPLRSHPTPSQIVTVIA